MKNYNLLFSFSFAALSIATLTGGALFVQSAKGKIEAEPAPIPALLPHPAPVDAAPPVLELPDTVVIVPKVKAAVRHLPKSALAIQAPVKEKQMVCNSAWQDSNYGGQYRVCEMK